MERRQRESILLAFFCLNVCVYAYVSVCECMCDLASHTKISSAYFKKVTRHTKDVRKQKPQSYTEP